MGKVRVYELAKELAMESKALIRWLNNMGISVNNHMSTLTDEELVKIRTKAQGKLAKEPEVVKSTPSDVAPVKEAKPQQTIPTRNNDDRTRLQNNQTRPENKHNNPSRQNNPNGQRTHNNQQSQQSNQARPQQSNQARPQQSIQARPQQSNQARPQQSNQARPQQSNQARPQQSNQARPQQSNQARPQQSNLARPQQGNQARPQQSNQARPQQSTQAKPNSNQRPANNKDNKKKDNFALSQFDKPKSRGKKGKKQKGQEKNNMVQEISTDEPIMIESTVTVQELADKMGKAPAEIIKKLMLLGTMATINQELDVDTASLIADDFGFTLEVQIPVDEDEVLLEEEEDNPEDLITRPCVVTIMGHVDHGKTSLLDAIRSARVTATEAGGITQHIGAYQVEHNNKKITFLDTPGHEAFTAMRARGAQVTDIAILVVAADDGVMPQTVEAINHAKAANVPIIVAINKMDKEGANPDRVKQELTEHGLVVEEWGGETISVPVSAKTQQGLDDLLEMILLVAEVNDYKANPDRRAKGTVVEAQLDKGRGPVATVLVQTGTLHVGDAIVAGTAYGKVRAMVDDKGRRVKKAGPSTPVEVLGLSGVPLAGDVFSSVVDDRRARVIAEKRISRQREEDMKTTSKVSLEDLFKHIQEGQMKELNIIIKADVQGSIEALKQSLAKLSTDEVRVNPIHGGVGAIRETDIMLASASNAIIIGFNVRPDTNAAKAAEVEKVDVRLYRVIYNAIEDVKAAMEGLLDPDIKEVVLGKAEIRQVFRASKIGTIAGSYVTEGKITRDAHVRLIRDGIVIHEGKLDTLKRFKDDVKEVASGYECGITIERFTDVQENDVIEAFTFEEVKREL